MMASMYVAAAARQPTKLMMLEAAVDHAVAYETNMDVEDSTICRRWAEDLVAVVAHNNDDVVRVLCVKKKYIKIESHRKWF